MITARFPAAVALLGFALSGCVTNNAGLPDIGTMFTSGGGLFGQVDPTDVCGTEHAELADAQNYFTRSVVEAAMAGGLAGGVGGLAVGAMSGADIGKSTLWGALTGTVTGGVGGYFAALQKQTQDQREVASKVWDDVQTENRQIDRATVTFIRVRECRFRAAERIKADHRAGAITRDEAQRRLLDQRNRFEQEITLARAMGARMAERQQEFRFAADEVRQSAAPDLPSASVSPRTRVEPRPPRNSTARPVAKPASTREMAKEISVSATETNLDKRNAFESEVATADQAKGIVFAIDGGPTPAPVRPS